MQESTGTWSLLARAIPAQLDEQPAELAEVVLHDYQMDGLRWMLGLHDHSLDGILADEMGVLDKEKRRILGCIPCRHYLMDQQN